ncbi:MAG: [FeFe] hydrogenase H-cluster maturation GTPase HydF [Clostridia bacterium]|nr:[FeFe] hydrogenase H-cluster maturation GTPase HydF [Clostridia bacterium]
MSLNDIPSSERLHIGFFGCRNAGKSSVVNAVTGQKLSVVSDIKGTTTDPVRKAMEILPLGPVVIIDTPGFDDTGVLGEERVSQAKTILAKTDIAVLVVDSTVGLNDADRQLLQIFRDKEIPYIIVLNKCDLLSTVPEAADDEIYISAADKTGITDLKERLGKLKPEQTKETRIAADFLEPGDTAVLVCPIDESAPKGRLILPQQQTIRDILDAGCIALVTKETELEMTLESLKKPPALVVTDSQALSVVSRIVPDSVPLTTFSILMARYKGFLKTAVQGIARAKNLKDNDIILMAEGCTHHRQCNDIGYVKIPKLLKKLTGRNIIFEYVSGTEFPDDLSVYSMVIHCGACMNTDRDVQERMNRAVLQGVPFTNYGITIAQATGTLERTIRIMPDIHSLL